MQNKMFLHRKQGNNFPENISNALLIYQIINASEHGCLYPQFSIVSVKIGLKNTYDDTHKIVVIYICRLKTIVKC